jgi:hypothetical protein
VDVLKRAKRKGKDSRLLLADFGEKDENGCCLAPGNRNK